MSRWGVAKFLKTFLQIRLGGDLPQEGFSMWLPKALEDKSTCDKATCDKATCDKATCDKEAPVEEQMRHDDETTGFQLHPSARRERVLALPSDGHSCHAGHCLGGHSRADSIDYTCSINKPRENVHCKVDSGNCSGTPYKVKHLHLQL